MSRTLILDNGAYSIKAALIDPSNTSEPVKSLVIPNCVGASPSLGRGLVGMTLSALPHYHSLMQRRPMERGLLVDAELQAHAWDAVLARFLISREDDVDVVLTLPHCTPPSVIEQWSAVLQVAFRFRSVTIVSSALLASVAAQALGLLPMLPPHPDEDISCATAANVAPQFLVLDLGFSHCVATPLLPALPTEGNLSGRYVPVVENVCRMDVGGKLLTNRLKEVLSHTQVNLLEDTWLVNCVKESCCFVAPQGGAAHLLRLAENTARPPLPRSAKRDRDQDTDIVAEATRPTTSGPCRYVLPTIPSAMPVGIPLVGDTSSVSAVKLSSDAQVLTLRHERFVIPEALFRPEDVGIGSLGLVDTVLRCYRIPGTVLGEITALRRSMPVHVLVCGGGASMVGVVSRVEEELTAAFAESPKLVSVRSITSDNNAEVVRTLFSLIHSTPSTISTTAFRVSVDSLLSLCGGVVLFSPGGTSSLFPGASDLRAEVERRGRIDLTKSPHMTDTTSRAREKQPRGNTSAAKAETTSEALVSASQAML